MQIAFIKCQGSGNDFPLMDARAATLAEAEWKKLARALADRAGPVGGDGLLLLTAGDADHAFGMRMFNSDGSEAETCLNGLRCTARLGFELLGLDHARVRLKTSSADVAREPDLAPGVVTIRTQVGPASLAATDIGLRIDAAQIVDAPIPGLPSERHFTGVAMPNPHLVAFVDHVDEAELVALGDWCEAAPPLIPARANVSFVEARDGGLFVRTYERGVGLTDSCGSAMAASTFAAGLAGRIAFGETVTVFNRGGMVRASATAPEAGAVVTIRGNASFLYDATIGFDRETGMIEAPLVHARRFDEAEAWEAVLANLK
ncbi:diaminopimelate epimerase [Stakelama tenebrarum]|uniref:Diaminopimelate epimerase n=1 Tax=Stakelama tenebrarum TaxID=2711215 RepID=A0A6G6YA43_9SPHN|nr:diaminopimelate epimerase [Sphingosinithalassobacter tenebrarum]QIG81578.1 diaminopimelate epimerase [Sphingosinithalassobacter tenebrarum]